MRARDHTRSMLQWWREAEVDRVDLAVRRSSSAMLWHYDLPVDGLPLDWARAENLRRADVYARPARGHDWPVVFLDDVAVELARRIARKYSAAVIHTSPLGGCHVWLQCTAALDEEGRREAQRWLGARCGADPGSVSGEHLGRLAGLKNWKRAGVWVNVLAASRVRPWAPVPCDLKTTAVRSAGQRQGNGPDTSRSARDWAWVCRCLEVGQSPEDVYGQLVASARERRGKGAERYARRTVSRAREHISRP